MKFNFTAKFLEDLTVCRKLKSRRKEKITAQRKTKYAASVNFVVASSLNTLMGTNTQIL
jgi:hypothetical protein